MTKLAVPIIVQTTKQAHASAAIASEHGADLVEYRIDNFVQAEKQQLDELTKLIEESPLPCIITCRPTWEGGFYDDDEQSRISIIQHINNAKRQPLYLDIELKAYQASANIKQKVNLVVDHPDQTRDVETRLILSSHDFTTRPPDLMSRIEDMSNHDACAVIKIVWTPRSLRDNIEVFEILESRFKPTIALCMGELGLASRILSKKFGASLTFATLDQNTATASGQPTIQQCKNLYRWDSINKETKVYGVIGDPVGHSISPHIHNAGFDETNFNGVYLPMPIPGQYEAFKATVGSWIDYKSLDFKGASVTIPHKQNLLRFVEEQNGQIEPLAKIIGAANTLTINDDGSLYASNTDYAAALDTVCEELAITRKQLKGKHVAVLGAGGVARAIVAGFASYGATVAIYNRTHEKAEELAQTFDTHSNGGGVITAAPIADLYKFPADIIINCTSVGMSPNIDKNPLPTLQPGQTFSHWNEDTLVFDTIYNPKETKLIKFAKKRGCKTVNGAKMFAKQAAAQFKLWTNLDAPLETFQRVVEKSVKD